MENKYSPYVRLQTYINFFSNNGFSMDEDIENGYTFKLLEKRLGIPLSVIRRDIAAVLMAKENISFTPNYSVNPEDDDEDFQLKALKEKYKNDLDWTDDSDENLEFIKKLILDGEFDDVPIVYNDTIGDFYELPLTSTEYKALMEWEREKDDKNIKFPFLIKDSYRFKRDGYESAVFNEICEALEKGRSLHVIYKTLSGRFKEMDIKPLKLVYQANDNEYALLTIVKHAVKAIRLDNIKNIKIIKEEVVIPKRDMALLDNIENVWGFDYSAKPKHVRIKFYNIGNVWEKVRKELFYRTKGKLEERDGFLYYEDECCGLDALKSWVFGFGAAAIVEEPAELREKIIESMCPLVKIKIK